MPQQHQPRDSGPHPVYVTDELDQYLYTLTCIFTTATSTSHPDPCSTTSQQHPTHVQNNSISRGGNTTPGVTPITTYKAMQVPTKPFPARPASATTGEPPSRRGCHCPPGHCWTYARTRTVAPWWLRTTLSLSASPIPWSRTGCPLPRAACFGWSRAL